MSELTDKAIAIVEKSRQTHVEWESHLRRCVVCNQNKELVESVGDIDHHRKCISDYDIVLEALRA